MWSLGGVGFFGINYNTALTDKILANLPEFDDPIDLQPTQTEYKSRLNEIPFYGALYVTATPFYGKLAAFGKAFVNFDFYASAGLAVASLKSDCDTSIVCDDNPEIPDNDPNNDPPLSYTFMV